MTPSDQSPNSFLRCEYCRGMVPAGEAECLRCGAPLQVILAEPALQEMSIDDFILASHQKLAESGTTAAELAFGVGCTLEVLVAGMLMVIIFFAFTKVWTELVVILFILALISFLVSTILATRAREATTRKTFEREIKPEIDQYISRHGISHDEFIEQASEVLPASAPLLIYAAGESASN
jgi:hypothetical protein